VQDRSPPPPIWRSSRTWRGNRSPGRNRGACCAQGPGEIALAGNAEQPVDAVGDEAIDDQLTNGAHLLKLLWQGQTSRARASSATVLTFPLRAGTAAPMWSRGSRRILSCRELLPTAYVRTRAREVVAKDLSALHDEFDALEFRNVICGIAGDDDQIRILAFFYRSDSVAPAYIFCGH
jgi:hypothetical protein